MALDLNEYIKMSYERPNRKVLEGLGASESLIEYLMETPGNTNWNVVDSITNPGGGGDAEVWLVGDTPETTSEGVQFWLRNNGETDYMTELIDNASSYQVFLNGEELSYFMEPGADQYIWADSDTEANVTKYLLAGRTAGDQQNAFATYTNASSAPTSVEVSVEHK